MQNEITLWITANEEARRLGVSKDRIYDDVHHRRLQRNPASKPLMVSLSDVEAMQSRQTQNLAPAEDGWITTAQLASLFRLTVKVARKQSFYPGLTRRATNGNLCYFRLEEAEAILRDPDRLRREANRERLHGLQKILRSKPADAVDISQTARRLQVTRTAVLYLITHGGLAAYRADKKPAKYWLSAAEVDQRRARREREKEEKEYGEAFPVEKLPRERTNLHHLLPRGKRVGVGDLSEWERHFGDWITTRQTAWMLNVTMNVVYVMRCTGRLNARKEHCWFNGREQWHFRKTDVIALMNDPAHIRGRGIYAKYGTPEARAANKEAQSKAESAAKEA